MVGELAGGLGKNTRETNLSVDLPQRGGAVGSGHLRWDSDHVPLILVCLTPFSPALPPLTGEAGVGGGVAFFRLRRFFSSLIFFCFCRLSLSLSCRLSLCLSLRDMVKESYCCRRCRVWQSTGDGAGGSFCLLGHGN